MATLISTMPLTKLKLTKKKDTPIACVGFLRRATTFFSGQMAVCQNLVPLVNIKIAGKWMFIPIKNGINRYWSIPKWERTAAGSKMMLHYIHYWSTFFLGGMVKTMVGMVGIYIYIIIPNKDGTCVDGKSCQLNVWCFNNCVTWIKLAWSGKHTHKKNNNMEHSETSHQLVSPFFFFKKHVPQLKFSRHQISPRVVVCNIGLVTTLGQAR